MKSPDKKKRDWKKILVHELVEYLVNFCYLALVFGAFTWYRRIVLAAHDILYTNYWVPMIEALILAKVISIGGVFRLGRGLEEKPLIYPTLYKTVVFTLFIAVFTLSEHAIKGLLQGKGLMGGLADYFEKGPYEFLAGCLIFLVALIPFFGVKELQRVYGTDEIRNLFFRKRASDSANAEEKLIAA